MTSQPFFSSSRSALTLGLGFVAASLLWGSSYAQLQIPTSVENNAITIKKIFLSKNGVTTQSHPDTKITLDGTDNGDINAKGSIT